jgi:diaminopimelate epimerase
VAYIELGDPGVPHAVKEVPGLRWEMGDALKEMARGLRYDPAFPKGANVNLYSFIGKDTVRILTFERGVEDYTLACGTGSASTALTLLEKGLLSGDTLTLENRGGTLKVTITDEGIYLEGPTEVIDIHVV